LNAVTGQKLMITTSSCTVGGKATFAAVNAKIAKKQIA
jgi:hypothetical protein